LTAESGRPLHLAPRTRPTSTSCGWFRSLPLARCEVRAHRIPDDLSAVECIPGILCRSYPVSHGTSTKGDAYDSTAFVIEEPSDGQSFLFFGDVGAGASAALDHLLPSAQSQILSHRSQETERSGKRPRGLLLSGSYRPSSSSARTLCVSAPSPPASNTSDRPVFAGQEPAVRSPISPLPLRRAPDARLLPLSPVAFWSTADPPHASAAFDEGQSSRRHQYAFPFLSSATIDQMRQYASCTSRTAAQSRPSHHGSPFSGSSKRSKRPRDLACASSCWSRACA
jgi:hypothetical protein